MGGNGDEVKKEEEQIIQMVITLHPQTGQIQLTGPIHNRTLAYGMLEMAREAIYDYKEKNKPQIQVPKGGIMDFVRNKRG